LPDRRHACERLTADGLLVFHHDYLNAKGHQELRNLTIAHAADPGKYIDFKNPYIRVLHLITVLAKKAVPGGENPGMRRTAARLTKEIHHDSQNLFDRR
jgi:hypothetical protein